MRAAPHVQSDAEQAVHGTHAAVATYRFSNMVCVLPAGMTLLEVSVVVFLMQGYAASGRQVSLGTNPACCGNPSNAAAALVCVD